MSTEYSRSVLKMVVAQICQTIGWHSINSTPLEFMVDLMQEYILRTAKLTHQYAEILGRTEANLDDIGLAFQHMNIDMQELSNYIKNVEAIPYPMAVPKFPIRRESHLNFLKPGSREVVTRPMHVHEHLPAMYPNTEEDYITEKSETLLNGSSDLSSNNGTSTNSSMSVSPHRMSPQVVFKRPGDPVSFESPIVKRVKVVEEGRPLREIHSVMMTTSGFLSPAREGKLPEARTPHQTRPDSPQSSSYPMVPPELKYDKKPKKIIKKGLEDGKLDKENKKKNRAKELFKPNKADDNKTKKLVGMKELAKLKALKPGGGKSQGTTQGSSRPSTPKIMSPKTTGSPKLTKKTEPKVKPEKVIDVAAGPPTVERKEDTIDKLPSEPDKQKLNIFKKISKPREDKEKDTSEQHKYKELDSRESSPGLIIDENNDKQALRNDTEVKHEEKKAPHTPDVHIHPDGGELIDLPSPGSDVYMFDDMSPPGTPSTPRTPELSIPPTPTDHKKKRKEKISKKKELKSRSPKHCTSPKKTKLSNDPVEVDILDRPKTPQAPEPTLSKEPVFPSTIPFPFFSAFPPAPGLIPHPMFPRFPLPLGRGGPGPHPAMPNLPLPPRFMNLPVKSEDFPNVSKNKIVDREKPAPPLLNESVPLVTKHEKLEKEKEEKPKIVKQDKEILTPAPMNTITMPSASTLTAPVTYPTPVPAVPLLPTKNTKVEKLDKNEKKSKEHKKEKKDKLKKKKDKKEKHKEKTEKVKEKKEKVDKKEKIEKVKEKKEKKDKRKEKEKEDKNSEAVPKITLKLGGTASPRPPTPDAVPMKKLEMCYRTIKTVVKKPEEETKREPSPELAKISALVTRPPKQKSASKKTEEGTLDGSPALPTDTFSANLTSVPLATVPRAKKSLFKTLPQREPPPPHFDPPPTIPSVEQQPPYYFDQGGRQVWICPACGNQDDGSPMVGCDDCDAWYHWVCVGMQVPPATSENWYCRFCIAKKQELHHDKKKKKRKKKVKVTA